MGTEPRYVDVNALGARSVVIGGNRYVPWVAIAEAQTSGMQRSGHGHWAMMHGRKCGEWRCSDCGFSYRQTAWNTPFRFCPNCGAKMDGGREDGET